MDEADHQAGPDPLGDEPMTWASESLRNSHFAWCRRRNRLVEQMTGARHTDDVWGPKADAKWDALDTLMETEAQTIVGIMAKLDAWLSDEYHLTAAEFETLPHDQLPAPDFSRTGEAYGPWLLQLRADLVQLTPAILEAGRLA